MDENSGKIVDKNRKPIKLTIRVEQKKSKRKKSNPSRIPQIENMPEVKKLLLIENKILSISDESGDGTAKETLIECRNAERAPDREALNNNLNKCALYGPPFVCNMCKQWFLSKEKLLMHFIVNHQKVPCQMCLLVFENVSALSRHERKAHLPLVCELCKQEFESNTDLNAHYESSHRTISCRFCGLLIQPVSYYPLHINRKHNVHENYCRDENLQIVDDWHQRWNFRCRMCNKNRPKKDLYGHFRMYHKVTAISMVSLVTLEKFEFQMNGSIDEVVPMKKPTVQISLKSDPDVVCAVCNGTSPKVPIIFHQIFCLKKQGCKYCFETFDDQYQLHYHKEITHKLFQCGLGCSNIASPNERELLIHYKKFHDIVACKFCDVFVSSERQKYDMHLINEHAIKDFVVEEVLNLDLFEVKTIKSKKTVTCCLCERDLTEMMSCVETVYGHYVDKHSIILKAIVGFNQSNPFSPVKTPELPTPLGKFDFGDLMESGDAHSEGEDEDEKDVEEYAEIVQDVNPEYMECITNEGSSDEDDSVDPSLLEVRIKEEPLDEDEETEIFNSIDLNRFTCDLCDLKFLTKSELLEHSQIFHGFNAKLPLLTCDDCFETFTNESNLELHLINVHGKSMEKGSRVNIKCPFCNLVSFKKHIRYHVQKEHAEELVDVACKDSVVGYKCNFCNSLFWKHQERNDHEIKEHYKEVSQNIFKCYVCFKEFSRKFCLRKHVEFTHTLEQKFLISKMSYKCLQCCVLLPRLDEAREHFHTQHPDQIIHRCSFVGCNVRNASKEVLEVHVKTSHLKPKMEYVLFKPKPCEICGKYLASQKSAKIHYRMKHTGERIGYGCRLCAERFDTTEKRKLHYAIVHTGLRAYICSVCGKGFNSKSGLYGHKQLHNNFSFECEYCHKIFIRKDTYNEHVLIHSGPRHQCQYCPRAFTQRSNLIRHTRIHTGEKPYQCPMCPKRFSDKGACNSHVRVHTREEECSCPFCGKTYSKKQKLKYHLKKHTGEEQVSGKDAGGDKTFSCSECKQVFTDAIYLRRHIITTHFKAACNYKCQLCGQKFITQNHLNSHILSHSGVKHSQCLLCEAAYASEENIIQHLREVHKIIDEKEIDNYFKQNSFEQVTENSEEGTKDTRQIDEERDTSSPKKSKSPSSSNKRRKSKQFSDDEDLYGEFAQQTFVSTKSRQVKKPKRYIEESDIVFMKAETENVDAQKFLEVQIKEEPGV